MGTIISASIDLTKIDKSKIIKGKNGAEYYNIQVMINDKKDKYDNDVSVIQGQTKEERQRKDNKQYIGNGRVIWSGEKKENNNDINF